MRLRNVLSVACAAAVLTALIPATLADEPVWRFAVISDTQGYTTANNGIGQYANMIAKAIVAEDPSVDFALMGGELVCGDEGRPGQPPYSTMLQIEVLGCVS